METFYSSSFLSTFPLPKVSPNQPTTKPPLFQIFAVRLEDKPTTQPQTPFIAKPRNAPTKGSSLASKRRVEPSLATTIFNAFDDIINNFIDPPLKSSVDPRHVLSDNFAPVDELPPTECQVIFGKLPSSLNGVYIRNGPNPQFLPRGPYHLFDGDGMLHAITISNGRAILCSRYIKTYKYMTESQVGSPVIPNVFSGFNGLTAYCCPWDPWRCQGPSRTIQSDQWYWTSKHPSSVDRGKLLAMGESDLPYVIKIMPDGEVVTLGRHDFNGKLVMSMTAHPKIDPDSGEAFGFRYGPVPPFLTYFRISAKGEKEADVPVFSMTTPSFLHDFAITKKYAIFGDIQIGMDPMGMISGGPPVGTDLAKVPRVGIIPRYAKDESQMKWFDVPGFNNIHAINAWDEGDTVVMVAPNILSVEHTLERMDLVHASVEKLRINVKTGMVSRHPISTRNLDFGVINPKYQGKKNRYVYAAMGDPMPKISGVVKLDISTSEGVRQDCTVASRLFGKGCYGGEPFFVAKDPNNLDADEDDGYIMTYVHNENSGESRFLVMDAKSPNLEIIAAVKLPHRVPYGFHGLFLAQSDLNTL